MHPPLDRPHPDCQDVIEALQQCHTHWSKYWGTCNDTKAQLDHCLKAEKKRLLSELNANLVQAKQREQEIVKIAFGKEQTFDEYLAQDVEYQAARRKAGKS